MRRSSLYVILAVGIVVTLLLLVAWCGRARGATLTFFDVGQGDSILIERGTTQVLVDGGPSRAVVDKLGEKMPFFDRTIELVFLTHPDADHFSGLIDVLRRYEVKKIVWTGARSQGEDFQTFLDLLDQEPGEKELAAAGEEFLVGETKLTVLYPFTETAFAGQSPKDTNDTSIVLRVDAPQQSVLLTGDAAFAEEKELLDHKASLDVDVLKAGHHGSKYSSSETFIAAVSPQMVVFSVGADNHFGHPAAETMRRFEASGAQLHRTDREGDIEITLE